MSNFTPDDIMICGQVHLAVLQFLTTSLPPFAPEIINGEILKKLLKLDVFRSTKNHPNSLEPIVKKGFPSDFFVLIIEGKVTESSTWFTFNTSD